MRSGSVVIDKRGNIGSVLSVDATYPGAWVFVELEDIPGVCLQYREPEIRELPESTAVEDSRRAARYHADQYLPNYASMAWAKYCDEFNLQLFTGLL